MGAIVSAQKLRNADTFSKSDPYCVCSTFGSSTDAQKRFEVSRTPVIQDELNPKWKHTFKMSCKEEDSLLFQVWDEDPVYDDLLGQAIITHDEFYDNGFNQEVTLTDGKGNKTNSKLKLWIYPWSRRDERKKA